MVIFLGSFCIWNFSERKPLPKYASETLAERQGEGVMSEVLKRMLGFAFFELGLNGFMSSCQPPTNEQRNC